jgi:chromosome partitioning protein
MSRVIAIVNQKGGVGKTTTAINLCASLAALEKRTLLVDLDPQSNATSGLGLDLKSIGTSVYDVLLDGVDIRLVVQPTEVPFLSLAPSSIDLVGAEVELSGAENREARLREALQRIREEYDFLIVDCPPSLGLLTLNGLVAADEILIPIQCEYYALEGLGQLLKTVELVRSNLNLALKIGGIILTMFDARLSLAKQVAEDIRQHFPDKVFETVIPRNVRLAEAPSFGKPVLLYDITSSGAQSYLKLAEEFLKRHLKGINP